MCLFDNLKNRFILPSCVCVFALGICMYVWIYATFWGSLQKPEECQVPWSWSGMCLWITCYVRWELKSVPMWEHQRLLRTDQASLQHHLLSYYLFNINFTFYLYKFLNSFLYYWWCSNSSLTSPYIYSIMVCNFLVFFMHACFWCFVYYYY